MTACSAEVSDVQANRKGAAPPNAHFVDCPPVNIFHHDLDRDSVDLVSTGAQPH